MCATLPVALTWNAPLSFTYNSKEQTVTAAVSNSVNNDIVTVTTYTGNTATAKGSYTAEATALSNANYTPIGGSNLTQAWEITSATPTLTLANKTAVSTGKPIEIGTAKVVGVGTDGDITTSYPDITYIYYIDATCKTQTTNAAGAAQNGGAPSKDGTYYVKAAIGATANYTAAEAIATLTIYTFSGGGSVSSYTLSFDTNGGSAIDKVSKTGGTAIDLSAYKPPATDMSSRVGTATAL